MAKRRYMFRSEPSLADMSADAHQELEKFIEENSGQMLPAPRIFPPIFHFIIDEDAFDKAKELKVLKGAQLMNEDNTEVDE